MNVCRWNNYNVASYKYLKRILCKYISVWVCGIICIGVICILKFSDFRPFGSCTYATAINGALETMAFSILAAIVFFIVNDIITSKQRVKISIHHIEHDIEKIRGLLRQMIDAVEPFKLERKRYTVDSFKQKFQNKNLYDGYWGGDRSMVDVYTYKKLEIERIANALISSYSFYMSNKELGYIDKVLTSYFIMNSIAPMDFSIPEDMRISYPNNQEEIGKSLYELYMLR